MKKKKIKPLGIKDVSFVYQKDKLKTKKKNNLPKDSLTLIHKSATKSLLTALSIDSFGYNIFLTGYNKQKKFEFLKDFFTEKKVKQKEKYDWLYFYNFDSPNNPKILRMTAGKGKVYVSELSKIFDNIVKDFNKKINEESYEIKTTTLLSETSHVNSNLLESLTNRAAKLGFAIKVTSSGVETSPIIDNETLTVKEYSELPLQVRKLIQKNRESLDPYVVKTIRKMRLRESKLHEGLVKKQKKILTKVVKRNLQKINSKYKKNKFIISFHKQLQEDMIDNFNYFIDLYYNEDLDVVAFENFKKKRKLIFSRYQVNLFVDNSKPKSKTIFESYPSISSVFGLITKQAQPHQIKENHLLLESGSIHKANGGFIILDSQNFLKSDSLWSNLKQAIKEKKIKIPQSYIDKRVLTTEKIEPEAIPLNLSVILVGSEDIYYLLYEVDEDFEKLFKFKIDLDAYLESNYNNIKIYFQILKRIIKQEGLLNFSQGAMYAILEYSCRLLENNKRLSTELSDISDLMVEASLYSEQKDKVSVNKRDVERAQFERLNRINNVEKSLLNLIKDRSLSLSVKGKSIGECNALCVYDLGNYSFGRVNKVSCVITDSEDGIVNIERSCKLSGKVYNKGSQILTNYLLSLLSQHHIASFSASVCFEQSYDEIDGDSASAAELATIVSAISQIPIKQNFAVTGSLNQLGAIQAVGGINEKIEGYYKTARLISRKETLHIIIPHVNKENLVLNSRTKKAVAEKRLMIYPVEYFFEVFELLTDVSLGIKNISDKRILKDSALSKIKELSKEKNKEKA